MALTLISFLGRGRRPNVGEGKSGYELTEYGFPEGGSVRTAYFGLALARHLKADRIVILGTSSSSWDVFAMERVGDDAGHFGEIADLQVDEHVRKGTVDQVLLDRLAPLLSRGLGFTVDPLLVPFARTEAEQIDILRRLSERVVAGETLALDVTHGFRHLPMLAMVAARYLARVRAVEVTEIYYGALEMSRDGVAPVLRLSGLLRMLDWVDALSSYDKDGDFGVFAPLLAGGGLQLKSVDRLRQAAFQERTGDLEAAKSSLASIANRLGQPLGGLAALFQDELVRRVAWSREPDRPKRELAVARSYLERGDYLRAVTFLLEAAVTGWVYRNKGNDSNFDERDFARKALLREHPELQTLAHVRNALAHGLRSDDITARRALKDETVLRTVLEAAEKIIRALPN